MMEEELGEKQPRFCLSGLAYYECNEVHYISSSIMIFNLVQTYISIIKIDTYLVQS